MLLSSRSQTDELVPSNAEAFKEFWRFVFCIFNGNLNSLFTWLIDLFSFLDASSHLYKRPCPSVRPLVRPLVGWSVTLSSKSMKNGLLRILNDSEGAGRVRKRDEEGGGTRRKEGQEEWAGRSDEDKRATMRAKKWKSCKKNEKWKSGLRTHRWPPGLFFH